jgi:hypothetical protein
MPIVASLLLFPELRELGKGCKKMVEKFFKTKKFASLRPILAIVGAMASTPLLRDHEQTVARPHPIKDGVSLL